jgi:hypothetical protein
VVVANSDRVLCAWDLFSDDANGPHLTRTGLKLFV